MAEAKKKKEVPKIDIFRAWCKACGICVAFCPTGALGRDEAGYPYVKDIEKCINADGARSGVRILPLPWRRKRKTREGGRS